MNVSLLCLAVVAVWTTAAAVWAGDTVPVAFKIVPSDMPVLKGEVVASQWQTQNGWFHSYTVDNITVVNVTLSTATTATTANADTDDGSANVYFALYDQDSAKKGFRAGFCVLEAGLNPPPPPAAAAAPAAAVSVTAKPTATVMEQLGLDCSLSLIDPHADEVVYFVNATASNDHNCRWDGHTCAPTPKSSR
eukprot:TRINITY_DN66558_c9_g12_i1.p1 TRINITY_DN66558_c9_g12~~TRINITY_DN66558_c9_g12_i1.p1  ORF type:complete len:204 (-),score=73.92 TRINITY_DN66558_c9_g12_i1:239-814(-)